MHLALFNCFHASEQSICNDKVLDVQISFREARKTGRVMILSRHSTQATTTLHVHPHALSIRKHASTPRKRAIQVVPFRHCRRILLLIFTTALSRRERLAVLVDREVELVLEEERGRRGELWSGWGALTGWRWEGAAALDGAWVTDHYQD